MAVAYLRQAGIPSRNRLSELTVVAQSLLFELQTYSARAAVRVCMFLLLCS